MVGPWKKSSGDSSVTPDSAASAGAKVRPHTQGSRSVMSGGQMSRLSQFLPLLTGFIMAVNGQIGAQEDGWTWFYRQVAAALRADDATEQQRAPWPGKEKKKVLISTPSLKLKVEREEIILTGDGKNEEQNTASPPRQPEVHPCLISSNTLRHIPDPLLSQIFVLESGACTFLWLVRLILYDDYIPGPQRSCKSDKVKQNFKSSPRCLIKLRDHADLSA